MFFLYFGRGWASNTNTGANNDYYLSYEYWYHVMSLCHIPSNNDMHVICNGRSIGDRTIYDGSGGVQTSQKSYFDM